MELFENENINITKIYTVDFYSSKNKFPTSTKHYNANLKQYELIFYLSGHSKTQFGSRIIQDLPNSLRYLPKESGDEIYTVTPIEPSECIDIYFDTDSPMPKYAIGISNIGELRPLFEKACNIWSAKKKGYYAATMSVVYEIIGKIQNHSDRYFPESQKSKINPAIEYMMQNFASRDFDYKKMCSLTGLSYDYFKELFVSKFSVSPVKYVTKLRMEKAKELLITEHYTITEIAEICGFENVYYFSNVFKKVTGVSPKNYNNRKCHSL